MPMLIKFELIGPMMFNSIAEPMQRTDTGIAAPGKHQPISTAHADHLVVDDAGRLPDRGGVPSFLTNDFMRCPKGTQMCKTFDRNALAFAYNSRTHVFGVGKCGAGATSTTAPAVSLDQSGKA